MKPSLYPVQISKILPKPLPRLFLDPSYGPAYYGKQVVQKKKKENPKKTPVFKSA